MLGAIVALAVSVAAVVTYLRHRSPDAVAALVIGIVSMTVFVMLVSRSLDHWSGHRFFHLSD